MDFKEIFKSDRTILIACILLSGVFWLMNKMSQPVDWERTIPLDYTLPEGYVFSENPRKDLIFTAEATGWKMFALSRRDMDSLEINIPASPGNHTWNNEQLRQMIKDEKVEAEVNISKVVPFRLSVNIIEASRACYPVDLRKKFTYATGYQNIGSIILSPDTVCITGPSDLLLDIDYWPTDSLILTNIDETKEGFISIMNDHPRLLEIEPEKVKYTLEAAEYTELKKYAKIRIVNAPDADSVSLFPGRALLSMQVPLSRYEQAREQEINLFVNLAKKRTKESNIIDIQIPENLPDWMKNVQVNPRSVEYYFRSRDTSNMNLREAEKNLPNQ